MSAPKAESLLFEMEQSDCSEPDIRSYNTVINAWASSSRRDICGDRAEAILARMIENGHKPDRITFNSIIKAWSSAREPQKAEQYLKKMEADLRDTLASAKARKDGVGDTAATSVPR